MHIYTPKALPSVMFLVDVFVGLSVNLSVCLSGLSSLAFKLLHKQLHIFYIVRMCTILPGIVTGLRRGTTYRVLGRLPCRCRSRDTLVVAIAGNETPIAV